MVDRDTTPKGTERIRKELRLSDRPTKFIAQCLADNVLKGTLTPDHVYAFSANVETVVMADDPYRIIDADASLDVRVVTMAYIDELRTRMARQNVGYDG